MDRHEAECALQPEHSRWLATNGSFLSAYLLLKQQAHAIDHLVAIERRGCDVEEEAIQDRFGDPLQGNGQHERRQADEDVGGQWGQPSLLHTDNAV